MHAHNTDHFERQLQNLPQLGLGLGLRSQHFKYITENHPTVDWFEIISENFMDSGGRPMNFLRQIAEEYPLVMHGVSLSIGSTDPLNMDYLKRLKKLASEIQPKWISDHLCWTGVLGLNTHDLLPVPLNEETLTHIVQRIKQVQDFLERPLILENPSTYLSFQHSDIHEPLFLKEMAEQSGCGLLLDVNNVYVTCFNNEWDPIKYIEELPHERIVQMHLAGHMHCGTHIIDTHDSPVIDSVWELFRIAWQKTGGCSVLLEWDNHIPSFEEYHAEVLKAREYMEGEPGPIQMNPPSTTDLKVSNPVSFLVPEVSQELQ
jgi:hypothetical protein